MKLAGRCPKCGIRVFKTRDVRYVVNPKGRPIHHRCLRRVS